MTDLTEPLGAYCPDRGGLMFKVRADGNLEIACGNCRDRARRQGRNVWLVLHVYGPEGELVDTEWLSPIPAARG